MEDELELKRIRNLAAVHRYQDKNREKVREAWRTYYRNRYNKWVDFIKSLGLGVCSTCGYDKCFAAIEFHHIETTSKTHTISELMSNTFNDENKQILLDELKKCISLCANCHRELHYKGEI